MSYGKMNVDRHIHYWQGILSEYRPLLNISSAVFIEDTIKKLEWLKDVKPESNAIET